MNAFLLRLIAALTVACSLMPLTANAADETVAMPPVDMNTPGPYGC